MSIFAGRAQTALRRETHIDREELVTYRFPILYYHPPEDRFDGGRLETTAVVTRGG